MEASIVVPMAYLVSLLIRMLIAAFFNKLAKLESPKRFKNEHL